MRQEPTSMSTHPKKFLEKLNLDGLSNRFPTNTVLRMDFCHLNTRTKKDSYPLQHIQEVLESMASAAHFSTMSGFWQVKMAPDLQWYMAFTVGNVGFYELMHMPFGLCNAPATFKHLMQNTLGELNLTYCIIYLNDMIVFGCTEEEHLEHLHVVFEWFYEFNLKLKPSKCSFF